MRGKTIRKKTNILFLLLGIVFLVFISFKASIKVSAADLEYPDEDFDVNTDGSGTVDDPYLIHNAGQLYHFAQLVNTYGRTTICGTLVNDIVVNDYEMTYEFLKDGIPSTTYTWTPLCNQSFDMSLDSGTETNKFYSGIFDGSGYSISGLYVSGDACGFIGNMGNGGQIRNLEIKNSYFKGNIDTGVFCGQMKGSSIVACFSNDCTIVASGNNVGGICGRAYESSSTIENCYFNSKIIMNGHPAGIVGQMSLGTVSKCYYNSEKSNAEFVSLNNSGVEEKSDGKTTAQFENGEVTYLLNDGDVSGSQGFYQRTTVDVTPRLIKRSDPIYVQSNYIEDGVEKTYVYGTVFRVKLLHCDGTEFKDSSNNTIEKYGYVNNPLTKVLNENHNYSAGLCTYCGTNAPTASVNNDGVETYYDSIAEALAAASAGSEIIIYKDAVIDTSITIPTGVTLRITGDSVVKLNTKTIIYDYGTIQVDEDALFIINGNIFNNSLSTGKLVVYGNVSMTEFGETSVSISESYEYKSRPYTLDDGLDNITASRNVMGVTVQGTFDNYSITYSNNVYATSGEEKAMIKFSSHTDVSNVIIKYFTITRKTITITAATIEKNYDGNETVIDNTQFSVTSGSLASDDYIQATITGARTLVGSTPTIITDYTIFNKDGVDVTSSYEATLEAGEISILSRDVDYTDIAISGVYGTKVKDLTVSGGIVTYDDEVIPGVWVIEDSEDYPIVNGTTKYNVVFQTVEVGISELTVEIIPTISKIETPIDITASSASKTYDGESISGTYTYTEGVILSFDELIVELNGVATIAGVVENKITSYGVRRKDTLEDVTACYTFGNITNGSLEIKKIQTYITDLSVTDINYEQPLSESVITAKAFDEFGNELTDGTFVWEYSTYKPSSSEKDVIFYVLFIPSDILNYEISKLGTTVIVNKIHHPSNMPSETMDVHYKYDTVGKVELPEGWHWDEGADETSLIVGVPQSASATHENHADYEVYTVTITLTRLECDHCDKEYRNKVEPTCLEKGFSGDVYCLYCGLFFEYGHDEDALGHTGGTATCKDLAVCERCGEPYGELIDHVIEHIEEVPATNDENGKKEYWHCTVCDKCFEDEEATKLIEDITKYGIIRATGHVYNWVDRIEPTCTKKGQIGHYECPDCGKFFDEYYNVVIDISIDMIEHTFDEWESNSTYHYHICKVCGEKIDESRHNYETEIVQKPTKKNEGIKRHNCKVCGYYYDSTMDKLESGNGWVYAIVWASAGVVILLIFLLGRKKKKK